MSQAERDAGERAEVLLELGRPADAEAHVRRALSDDPNDPDLLVLSSRVMLALERFEDARDQAKSALAADPEAVIAHSCLAAALSGLKDYDAALKVVRRAVTLAPSFADLHRQHAEICLASGQSKAALAAAKRAWRLNPRDSECAAVLAAALFDNQQFAAADDLAAEALRLDPENARAHSTVGFLRLRQGGGAESIARYREALRLDPTDVHAREGLALALKTRNPVYGWTLRFEFWMSALPTGKQWAVRLTPLILIKLAEPFRDQVWSNGVLVIIGLLLIVSWGAEPAANLTLMTSPSDRAFIPPRARRAAVAFAVYMITGIGCVIAASPTGLPELTPVGFGIAMWGFAIGTTHTINPRRQRQLEVLSVLAIGCAVIAILLAAVQVEGPATVFGAIVFIGGAAALLSTALAN
ncbi:MAG: hypothetical protein JWL73_2789 [Actinomycetia bacterium]|jgi:tetratricopeptide (TPR) repeat protein|nr:hypothetical protein [Actinomycetes bacterium]